MNELFYCYSTSLRKFLGLAGLRWQERGFNEKTKSYYWTFNRTKRFDELMEEYMKLKDSNSQ